MLQTIGLLSIGVFSAIFAAGTALAETREVGPESAFKSPCEAIETAEPGDVINITAGSYSGGSCTVRVPDVQIRGVGGTPKISGGDPNNALWQISADGVVIDNVDFTGNTCDELVCSVLRIYAKNVTLSNVSIHGGTVGVKMEKDSEGWLAIKHSDISHNTTNIIVNRIGTFILQSSYVHDALGGDQIRTKASRNEIMDNRIGDVDSKDRREVMMVDNVSSVISHNVFIKGADSADTAMLQTVSRKVVSPKLELTNNTFASYLGKGAQFVEHVGNLEAQINAHKNIFWGSGVLASYVLSQNNDNYSGTGNIFEDESSYRLAASGVPADWGAPALTKAQAIGKTVNRMEATVTPAIKSITLATNPVFGAGYIFGNTVTLTSAAPTGGLVVTLASDKPLVAAVPSPTLTIAAGKTSGTFMFQTTVQPSTTQVTLTATLPGGTPFPAPVLAVGPVSLSSVSLESASVGGGITTLTNRVTVSGPAPAGGMIVNVASSKASAQVPSIVYVPAGMTSATFPITTTTVTGEEDAVITASHATGTTSATLAVMPVQLSNLQLVTGGSIVGGYQVLVRAQLNGPAPLGGSTVALDSSKPTVAPITDSSFVGEGETETTADSLTSNVGSVTPVTFTATSNFISKPAQLTVNPVAMYSLTSPTTVKAGAKIAVTMKLNGLAPAAGYPITLKTSDSTAAPVVPSVIVGEGKTSAVVYVTGGSVTAATPVTVTAVSGSITKTCNFTVNP